MGEKGKEKEREWGGEGRRKGRGGRGERESHENCGSLGPTR